MIYDEEAGILFESLKKNESLTDLDLCLDFIFFFFQLTNTLMNAAYNQLQGLSLNIFEDSMENNHSLLMINLGFLFIITFHLL